MPGYLKSTLDSKVTAGYLFPSISSLLSGYDFTFPSPVERIRERLTEPDCNVVVGEQVFFDGECVHENSRTISFRNFAPVDGVGEPFVWPDCAERWNGGSGYFELTVEEENRRPVFRPRLMISTYTIYSKQGKKSFFSDNASKYGVPPVIDMVAKFGKFVDCHPLIHLDRERDLGESVTLINPYQRPLVTTIHSHDGRTLPRIRVDGHSTCSVRLIDLLKDDENEWLGQIQLTANNRVVAYNVKHSLRDPQIVSDHEHLDPFRADAAHMPASMVARRKIGKLLARG